jgi:hypothetical protein
LRTIADYLYLGIRPAISATTMIDIYDFYERMKDHNVMISFKGEITSNLLSSILISIESKLDIIEEAPRVKKKVFNVLVECLQNLYHHIDDCQECNGQDNDAIFMLSSHSGYYNVYTGNYILTKHVPELKSKIDKVNELNKEELKTYYKAVLRNGQMSAKGGGGLGMIDIARKSGQKLEYSFMSLDNHSSFFTLKVKIARLIKEDSAILSR